MSELLGLRPYQTEAVHAIERSWLSGVRRPALVMATGTGKTLTAAHLIDRWIGPVLFLVHRDELAEQAERAFHGEGLDVGVVKAERDETDRRVVIGSVQTLANPVRLSRWLRNQPSGSLLIVIDEAHHASAPTYRAILTVLGAFDPESSTVALGLSATLARSDGDGLGNVWETVVHRYDILDGIADGYLCDVTGRQVLVDGLTLAQVRMTGGDFGVSSLGELLRGTDVIKAVIGAYNDHASDMPGIVFTPDVQSTHDYAAAFKAAGYEAAPVWGAMPLDGSGGRRETMRRARSGDLQILVNCMVLTEGTDLPRFQCAVIARPTTSAGIYTQMAGRVLRPFPGKDQALILDVVGASEDHRLATLADLSTRRINEVRQGETLREAAEREIKAKNPKLSGYVVTTEEVDLFHRSREVWLQTYDGLWFIPCGNALVFVYPSKTGDLYHVGIRPFEGSGGGWVIKDVDLGKAMAWGEQRAERYNERWQAHRGKSFGTHRQASWRRLKPSTRMIDYANSLGIQVPEDTRAGELSCIIDVERASAKLDGKGTG